jgi:uncharacterized protein
MNDNAESVVRAFYDHIYAGDIDAALTLIDGEFTWLVGTLSDELTAAIPWAGRILRGPEGFRELVEQLFGEFENIEFAARSYAASGEYVFVLGFFTFQHKQTGKKVTTDWMARFQVVDGFIRGGQFFENTYGVAAARH